MAATLRVDRNQSRLDGRAANARLALIAYMSVVPVSIVVSCGEFIGVANVSAAELDPVSLAASLVYVIEFIALILAATFVGMWIYRAHAELREAEVRPLPISPGWAVGWFFIPFANLFKPFDAMRELWLASAADDYVATGPRLDLLRCWWGAWIIGSILTNVGSRLPSDNIDAIRVASLVQIGSGIAMMIAAWLLLRIIVTITVAQFTTLHALETFA